MKTLFSAAVLTSLIALSGTAHANLILNGSFENGDQTGLICNGDAPSPAPGPYTAGCPWIQLDPTPAPQKLANWRVDVGVVNWHNNQRPGAPQDGLWHIDLNDTNGRLPLASLSQDFATTAGQSYLLSFYLSGPGLNFPNPRQVRVQVGNVDTVLGAVASNNDAIIWELENVTFQATGATSTLTFSSVNAGGFWGAFIDNVSVVATDGQVPAPATLMLLGLGLLGLRAARRAN